MDEHPDAPHPVDTLMKLEQEWLLESIPKWSRLLELTERLMNAGLWGAEVDEFAELREFRSVYDEFPPTQWWRSP
jgi:hypothetical protein